MDTPTEQPGQDSAGWDRRRLIGAAAAALVVLGVIALLVVGLINKDQIGTSIQDALAAGERPDAPDITLPVLVAGDGVGPAGAEVSLSDLRGRTVVLNFWASWCEPCQVEAPVLEEVASRYRGGGEVVVLGVDVQDLRERALGFVERNRLTYPTLRDGGDGAQNAFQVPALPETFVIDPQGRIALKIRGVVQEAAQLTTAIEQVRGEGA